MTESELREQLTAAMRCKDAMKLRALRAVVAAIKNKAIELRGPVPEREITALIQREVKQCRETLDFARKAERADQITEHEQLLAVLESLLPAGMSEAELREAIRAIVAETGAGGIGPVMKALGERYAGRYDGKTASALAREVLAG
ncbi:MAG: GatB/YqeY domain-containing protein [Deltaproteobacteria bacterium]|nr:GatB/YqeY domain-containing protein [Deltaproteobacteria bacterium]